MALEIRFLGLANILCEEKPVLPSGQRPIALLAYLVVTGKAHTRTHLTDLLFTASADPRAGLRWTLTKLRQAIGAQYILANREQIAFDASHSHFCDVDALLSGDLEVYHGDFLEGLTVDQAPLFDEWHLLTTQQLRKIYQDGLVSRIARHEMEGEHLEVADLAARLVQMDGLREEWRRTLMRAYAATGQWDAAREQYEQCRQLLKEELATTPSEETIALWHQLERRQLPQPFADQHGTDAMPWQRERRSPRLPFFRDTFVGRESEIREIQTTLIDQECRMLTLVGPGGIGKTRLAVQAMMNLEQNFEQGIFFVPLRQVTATDGLIPAIAHSLDLYAYGRETLHSQVLTYLRRKSILLLLDNMEHLLLTSDWTRGESILAEILTTAPGVRLLITSRERLHMPEEWLCPLAGLSFPTGKDVFPVDLRDFSAVQLFLHRARQIVPTYHPDDVAKSDLYSIGTISRRTSGMPLALEMAAAWVQQMSPDQIAKSIDDSLSLLITPHTHGHARHASMRSVFEHSWRLLTTDLQQLLARLAVFRGRFDLEAAASVAGATLFSLSALLDKSLLEAIGDGTYQVHELLRQFAAEQLENDIELATATHEAHSIHYSRLCHTLQSDLKGGAQIDAADIMLESLANIRAAFNWAVNHAEWVRLSNASFSLGYFCCLHGHIEEGRSIFEQIVDVFNEKTLGDGQALVAAHATYWLGQLAEGSDAIPFWKQARQFFELAWASGQYSDFDKALLYEALAEVSGLGGDYVEQERRYQTALDAANRTGDDWIEAKAFAAYAGLQVWKLARYEDAWKSAQEALKLQRVIKDRTGMVETLGTLSAIETFRRHYEQAIQLSKEALAVSQILGNDLRTAMAHRDVSWALLLAAHFDECIIHMRRAYDVYAHHGQDRFLAETLYSLAWRSCMGGHYEDARRYADELDRLLVGKGSYRTIRAFLLGVRSSIAFREERYAAALELAQESYRALAPVGRHNMVATVRTMLGFSYLANNDLESATLQAKVFLSQGTMPGLWGLSVVALVLVWQNPCEANYARFHELLALQSVASPLWDSPFYRLIIRRLQPPGLAEFSPEQRAMAEKRGRSLDPDATIASLKQQLGP